MNRERRLTGVNSYARSLGFDPAAFLSARSAESGAAGWLDLCCGEGNAGLEAAARLAASGVAGVRIVGVDLVGRIGGGVGALPAGLEFVAASAASWSPGTRRFDLVTCVHGLHYLGDKLDLLSRAAGWLTDDGMFSADFDPSLIFDSAGRSAASRVICVLRRAGAAYDSRRHRLSWRGPIELEFDARCLGADDGIGPGYTGQPAVASYYDLKSGD
jgi:SAM-dependent methyltransferase